MERVCAWRFQVLLFKANLSFTFGNSWRITSSRYMVSDPSVLLIEGITAVFWGPLCLYIAGRLYQINNNNGESASNQKFECFTHILILIVSIGQFYGDVLYFGSK